MSNLREGGVLHGRLGRIRWVVVGVAVLQLACAGLGEELAAWAPGTVRLQQDLDEIAQAEAMVLAREVSDGVFPEGRLGPCEDEAVRLTWLAARHDDPEVIRAALWQMVACSDALHPADVLSVGAARLQHDDVAVVGGAIALVGPVLGDLPADHPVVENLVDVVVERLDMPVRIAAIEALDQRPWSREPGVSVAFYDALMADSQPSLTATALKCLRFRGVGLSLSDRPRFQAATMVLAGDIDPGIRGYAALALARLDPSNEEVRGRIFTLLEDRHPYTRSAAAEALADIDYLPTVHALVAGLDDPEPNVWRMLPFERPDGDRARLQFVGSRFERVDDAFLRALERLTSQLEHKYRYREVDLRYRKLDIIAATREAVDWYEEHGQHLPRR